MAKKSKRRGPRRAPGRASKKARRAAKASTPSVPETAPEFPPPGIDLGIDPDVAERQMRVHDELTALEDALREIESVRPFDAGRAAEAAEALAAHPCSTHNLNPDETLWEAAQHRRNNGDYDIAISHVERAIDVGGRVGREPDPDCEIAELHLLAGRREQAGEIFADVRRRMPDDVWLYNSAGFTYQDVGDHETAIEWLDAGIDVAFETGDPEQLIVQLAEARTRSLTALGKPADPALDTRIDDFVANWNPPRRRRLTAAGIARDRPGPPACDMCGWPGDDH